MFERILVPLDGSEVAEAVLPQVRRLLLRHEAEVLLFTAVLPAPDLGFPATSSFELARRYIRRAAERLSADGIRARGVIRHGTAGYSILEEASRWPATLIALSSHGRSGLSRWTFGSVAEKILRSSPVPVLAVRSFEADRLRREELPFRTILVPVDGSGASLTVLPGILDLARPLNARVLLLQVQEPGEPPTEWTHAQDPVERANETLRAACIPATVKVRRGDPASEILQEASESCADLIAMSTHGRSGPSRWLLGSVTEKILRASPVPLFVSRRAESQGTRAAETA